MNRTEQLRGILADHPGRLIRATFIKGDTPRLRQTRRRRPERRNIDFVVVKMLPYPKRRYLIRVWDEIEQDYRCENLATTEALDVIGDGGEVLASYRAPSRRNLRADRMQGPRGFVASASEQQPLRTVYDAEAEYERVKAQLHELF